MAPIQRRRWRKHSKPISNGMSTIIEDEIRVDTSLTQAQMLALERAARLVRVILNGVHRAIRFECVERLIAGAFPSQLTTSSYKVVTKSIACANFLTRFRNSVEFKIMSNYTVANLQICCLLPTICCEGIFASSGSGI